MVLPKGGFASSSLPRAYSLVCLHMGDELLSDGESSGQGWEDGKHWGQSQHSLHGLARDHLQAWA